MAEEKRIKIEIIFSIATVLIIILLGLLAWATDNFILEIFNQWNIHANEISAEIISIPILCILLGIIVLAIVTMFQ